MGLLCQSGRERVFPAPVIYANLKDKVPLKKAARPDLVLFSENQGRVLELECKTRSFGVDTSTGAASSGEEVKQARTLLLLTHEVIAGTLGLRDNKSGMLVYVIATESVVKQEETLDELSTELRGYGQAPQEHSVWGMRNTEDGIYLCNVGVAREDIRVAETDDPSWEVVRTIPFDPSIDANDQKGVLELRELIRSSVAATVINIGVGQGWLNPVCECRKVIPIWDIWDPDCRKCVLRKARDYIRSILKQASKVGLNYEAKDSGYLVEIPTERERAAIVRYFSSPRYWQGDIEAKMPQEGPTMFEEPVEL